MKIFHRSIILLLAIFTLILAACSKNVDPDYPQTIDKLSQFALLAFKTNDVEKYLRLLSTAEDLRWMGKKYIAALKKSGASQEKIQRKIEAIKGALSKYAASKRYLYEVDFIRKTFSNIHRQGVKAGLDWSKTHFVRNDLSYTIKKYGIQSSFVYLIVKYKQNEYKIKIDTVVKTQRGWVVRDYPRWIGPVKNKAIKK